MEKRINVKIQEIRGSEKPNLNSFSRTFVYKPKERSFLQTRGTFYAVADISSSSPNFDFDSALKIALDSLNDDYFADLEGSVLQALEKSLLKTKKRVLSLVLSPQAAGGSLEFNLALAVLWGRILYVAKIGSSCIYLLRKGKIQALEPKKKREMFTASGVVQNGDCIILGTSGFKHNFPQESLSKDLFILEKKIKDIPKKSHIASIILNFSLEEIPSAKQEKIFFASLEIPSMQKKIFGKSRNILENFIFNRQKEKRKKLFEKSISLKKHLSPLERLQKQKSWKRRLLFFFLFFIFSAGVFFTINKKRQFSNVKAINQLLFSVDKKIEEAKPWIDLNNRRAVEILKSAQSDLEQAKTLFQGKNKEQGRVLGQKTAKVESLLAKANKIIKIDQPLLLYDLKIKDQMIEPKILSATSQFLFIFDNKAKKIYQLTYNKLPSKVTEIPEGLNSEQGFSDLFAFNKRLYLFTKKGGIMRFDPAKQNFKTLKIKLSDPQNVIRFNVFGGNFYFLDEGASRILKFSGTKKGFSKQIDWLKQKIDLSQSADMAVDGSIYILFRDGRIIKLQRGKKVNFDVLEMDKPFSNPQKIFTDSDYNYLYVLDNSNSRLVKLTKEGQYVSQYVLVGEYSGTVKDFYVDEGEKHAYILAGTKVIRLDL